MPRKVTGPERTRPRRRRRRHTSLCALLLATLLTACGALTPGSARHAGDRPRAVPTSTALPDEDITLRLHFADAPEMVEALVAAFEKRHPRVTVEPRYTQFSDYVKNLRLTMVSDTAPDLAQYAVGMDDLAADGHLLDLARYRKAYGWRRDVPAVSLDQLSGGDRRGAGAGPLYGLPAGLSMTGVYYNKELASRAGIRQPPRTLREFEKQLATARRAGMTPLSVGALDSGGLHLWAALLNVLMPPGDYRDWVSGRPGATVETAAARKASALVTRWARAGYLDESANGMGQVDSTARFAEGKSVFLVNGNWAAGQLAGSLGEKSGFFAMPGVRRGDRAMASGFSVSYAVSSRTEHPEAAGAFLEFLTSPRAARIVSEHGFLPPDPRAVPTPTGLLGDVARGHRRVTADHGINHFPDFTAPGMLDPLRAGVQKLIADRVSPSGYLASLQEVWHEQHG
ncbi:extracellular solute-binding protein [Streptomyces sp. AJS327]|uniref:ABC transporter substrate-binding protein n=1 Tax=Streptomyces sp. AJS327 TaxID=2545265 RepID=UPI0015DE451B|nr:extracellular solute-binding protein [Streptomyces sp. AJS327]MBA0053388.1 extracellular solute-binding protein [Streptomyces sp. AJS327]